MSEKKNIESNFEFINLVRILKKIFKLAVDMLGSEPGKEILIGLEQSLLRNINYKFYLFETKKKYLKNKKFQKATFSF